MSKYHLTENGPKACHAKPGNCPITKNTDEPHYSTIEAAQTVYEHRMLKNIPNLNKKKTIDKNDNKNNKPVKEKVSLSPSNLKITAPSTPFNNNSTSSPTNPATTKIKTYAPEKPDLKPVTLEEIHEIIDKYKNTKGLTVPKILEAPIVGYSLVGSSLYNLHHKDSDRDIFILTDSEDKKNYHKIFDDGTDIRVFTVKNFAQSILTRSPANIDIFKARMTTFDKNSPMSPYLNNLRFNKYVYIDGMESESQTQLRAALMRDDEDDKRASKSVKTALRNFVLSDRIYVQDQNYQPEFSDSQREEFYKRLEESINETNKTRKIVKEELNNEIEISTRYKGNPQLMKEDLDYQKSHEYVNEHLTELMSKLHDHAVKVNEA